MHASFLQCHNLPNVEYSVSTAHFRKVLLADVGTSGPTPGVWCGPGADLGTHLPGVSHCGVEWGRGGTQHVSIGYQFTTDKAII